MLDSAGTVETLVLELSFALNALDDMLAADNLAILFAELGLNAAADLSGDQGFMKKVSAAVTAVQGLPTPAQAVIAAIDNQNWTGLASALPHLAQQVSATVSAIRDVADDLARAGNSLNPPVDLNGFAATFTESLLGSAVSRYLLAVHPTIAQILRWSTLLTVMPTSVVIGGTDVVVAQFNLNLAQIQALLSDPLQLLKQAYQWGGPAFDGKSLFQGLSYLLGILDFGNEEVGDDTVDPNEPDDDVLAEQLAIGDNRLSVGADTFLQFFAITFVPTSGVKPPGIEGVLALDLTDGLTLPLANLSDVWSIQLAMKGTLPGGTRVQFVPPAQFYAMPPSGQASGSLGLTLLGQASDPTTPIVILGEGGGSGVQARQISIGASVNFAWDAAGNRAAGDAALEVNVSQGVISLDTSEADGYLQSILPADGLEAELDFDLAWDAKHGFRFSGGAGLDVSFPLHVSLGPIDLDTVDVAIEVSANGLGLPITFDGSGQLGPIAAEVEGIGFSLNIQFKKGNLGLAQLDVDFVPPTGLGLSVDATGVSGGGFVDFDSSKSQYAGGLELDVQVLQLKAFGLLDTKPEVTFVIIISADFPPIELGFGFALSGVGGLLGVNRSMALDPLRAAFRAHTLDDIVFLKGDIVSQAPTLIKGVAAIFPPLDQHYVIGPFVTITWSDPPIVSATLGIIISLPDPVTLAILGDIVVAAPDPETALILLNLDVLGTWDFDAKRIGIDASLYDSRVAAFPIAGDSAFRLNYGESPSFALSVGGLNPQFQPPPKFPTLKRMSISLGDGGNPCISVLGYFAVTPNSVQFGASAALTAQAAGFGIHGALGFDVLIVLSPFGFTIDLHAELDVMAGGSVLMSIHLDGQLSGTSPWHVQGDAGFSILFFSVSVHIDQTFGQSGGQQNPPLASTITPFQKALQDARNWSAIMPADAAKVASLAAPPATSQSVVVHPLGQIGFRQTIVPLNLTISKFGNATPSDATCFSATEAWLNNASTRLGPANTLRDEFADGQFLQMSDQDKVSKPSYTLHDSGAVFTSGTILGPTPIVHDVVYDSFVEDDPVAGPSTGPVYQPAASTVIALCATGPSARSPRRNSGAQRYVVPGSKSGVSSGPETYEIVSALNGAPRTDISANPASYYEAQSALDLYLANHPGEAQSLQLIATYELAA